MVIKQPRKKKNALSIWIIFLIGYLAYSSIYVGRLNLSVASTLLEREGLLNISQIGFIGSVFSFAYAIGKIPAGYLGDRISSKKILSLGLCLVGFSNLIIAAKMSFIPMAILWGINAFGQALLWGPMLRGFSKSCDANTFLKISQNLISSVAVGSIFGLLFGGYCASHWGLVSCFAVPGIIALVMAALIVLFFYDVPGEEKTESPDFFSELKNLFLSKDFRRMILPAMAHGMIKDNINVWLVLFFADEYKIDIKSIGGYVFLIPLFSLIGRLAYPIVLRKKTNGCKISAVAYIFCIIADSILTWFKPNAVIAMLCLGLISALIAVINSYVLSGFVVEKAGNGNMSFMASFMDVLVYGGAGIGSLIFGFLIEKYGYGSMFTIWSIGAALSAGILLYSGLPALKGGNNKT